MAQVTVSATVRTAFGKGPNRRLRAAGRIPAIVYGGAAGARALSLAPGRIAEIVRSARGVNTIFALEIEGAPEPEQVMIHDYQLHPLDHSVLHADLMRVDPDKESEWQVPVHLEGDSVGVKRGGHLDFVTRAVAVACRPHDIPAHLPLPISDLDYGDTVRASQLELPAGIALVSDPEVVVVHVAAPKVSTAEAGESEEPAEGSGAPEAAAEGAGAAS